MDGGRLRWDGMVATNRLGTRTCNRCSSRTSSRSCIINRGIRSARRAVGLPQVAITARWPASCAGGGASAGQFRRVPHGRCNEGTGRDGATIVVTKVRSPYDHGLVHGTCWEGSERHAATSVTERRLGGDGRPLWRREQRRRHGCPCLTGVGRAPVHWHRHSVVNQRRWRSHWPFKLPPKPLHVRLVSPRLLLLLLLLLLARSLLARLVLLCCKKHAVIVLPRLHVCRRLPDSV